MFRLNFLVCFKVFTSYFLLVVICLVSNHCNYDLVSIVVCGLILISLIFCRSDKKDNEAEIIRQQNPDEIDIDDEDSEDETDTMGLLLA